MSGEVERRLALLETKSDEHVREIAEVKTQAAVLDQRLQDMVNQMKRSNWMNATLIAIVLTVVNIFIQVVIK